MLSPVSRDFTDVRLRRAIATYVAPTWGWRLRISLGNRTELGLVQPVAGITHVQ